MPYPRKHDPARYTLPETVNPVGRKCFTIYVPDEKFHLAAFRGTLLRLGSAISWGDDDAHTAKDVAAVWRGVLDEMEACMPALQFRQPDHCTLQVSADGGATWSTIFNAHDCAVDAINASIGAGALSTPQQPPAGSVPADQCWNFHVTLQANQQWHSPVGLAPGYSVNISNVQGGWSDGYALGAYWQCPDGEYYSLGYCTGSYIAGYAGDPMPSVYHMRLIGHADAWFDAYNTSYIVPNGAGNVDLIMQANDSDLRDNMGAITFDVQICNYSSWCYDADLTTATHGFTIDTYGSWVSGTGFVSQVAGGGRALILDRAFSPTVNLTEVEAWVTSTASSGNFYAANHTAGGDTILWPDQVPHTQTYTWTGTVNGVLYTRLFPSCNGSSNTLLISRVRFHGTGVNPFGSSNC